MTIELPNGHRAADGLPGIEPRSRAVAKIDAGLAPPPVTGQRLDLEELLGERLAGFAKNFRRKVGEPDENGCRPWQGSRFLSTGHGMVRFYVAGRPVTLRAHRVALALAHSVVIPAGVQVRHSCRTRLCVNPAHLYPSDHRGELLSPERAA